jgi:hypothetical protein
MTTTFDRAKQAVLQATRLGHPDPQSTVSLAVDASDSRVGATMRQKEACAWRSLSFCSKTMELAQTRYLAFDRELLSATWLFNTSDFCWKAVNLPSLSHALDRMSELWSARQQRQLSYLAEFGASIQH